MNVEIGAEAALFPQKEYINGIAVAVNQLSSQLLCHVQRDQRGETPTDCVN
jgi:hypothetical protein